MQGPPPSLQETRKNQESYRLWNKGIKSIRWGRGNGGRVFLFLLLL